METPELQVELEGLSTRQALATLHKEIHHHLTAFQTSFNQTRWKLAFQVFRMGNIKSSFHWSSIVLLVVSSSALLLAYGIPLSERSEAVFYKDPWWIVEGFILLVILTVSCYLTGWDYALEKEEVARLLNQALVKLKECSKTCTWNCRNYPDIHSPLSPSVSLQWTLREGEVVNMPRCLLVKGDIIMLRPGQQAPARCRDLENDCKHEVLEAGEVFAPGLNCTSENFTIPEGRTPLKAKKFLLAETPYVSNIQELLHGKSERPVSLVDNERYFVCTKWIERRLVPAVFSIMIVVNVVRFIYLRDVVGDWTEMLLVLPIHALLPLLPVTFPWFWKLLNYYGQARLLTAFEICKEQKIPVSEGSFDSDSVISADEVNVNMAYGQVLRCMWLIVTGRASFITRQSNIMHTMGSVTSFCCVDKKGVLSWANPTAEKVFFMTRKPGEADVRDNIHTNFNNETIGENSAEKNKTHKRKKTPSENSHGLNQCHFEVLDLTHDAKSTFGLQFDDPTWQKNISSLKPLGLIVLLNTCNPGAKAWYSQFTDHVASSAVKNKETVAVVNRRCLCELSRQMGFSEKATVLFDLEQCFGIYKQVPAEEAAKERMHRAHSSVQHKIPMPNMVSVIVKEQFSGLCQLMSQGTADIILDSCSDYWDGTDLHPITEVDRKKMLDFYHRTSMASYCTAFSYRPLSQAISNSLQNYFIELPENCIHLHPSALPRESCGSTPGNSQTELERSVSADSLMGTNMYTCIEDIVACYSAQRNQIFIGMVTMQYQARQDIVQLIDQLETACIRFVHFSEENELRSRVFSEKMGLEAGWNCHISLMAPDADTLISSSPHTSHDETSRRTSKYSNPCASSESVHQELQPFINDPAEDLTQSLSKSYSAPSIINSETSQVKFRHVDNASVINKSMTNQDVANRFQPIQDLDEMDESLSLIGQSGSEAPHGDLSSSEDGQDGQSDLHTCSRITVNTLDSLTAMLDNRAKLPRGIADIRPHLENVDNVPLLVSLFTDCTQPATCEMFRIMQEYGEVVLCMGSSTNINNTATFLQADASVGVQPLLPQLCARQDVMLEPWEEDKMSPLQLASCLLSIPCSLFLKREDNIHFVQLIAEARHYLMMMRNCFQFMLCCQLSVSLLQVLASLFIYLPSIVSSRHLLWLICLVIPSLSLTMMGNQVDTRIMMEATSKNSQHITKEVILEFVLYYGLRFIPSVAMCLLCCGLNSMAVCNSLISHLANQTTSCTFFNYDGDSQIWNSWDQESRTHVSLIQNFLVFQLVLYFVLISVSYVHKYNHLWQIPPFQNRCWLVVCLTILLCQVIYFVCDLSLTNSPGEPVSMSVIPVLSWALALSWPLILIAYTEILKMQEIKLRVRHQKRAKLNFGTKLGMNSPF